MRQLIERFEKEGSQSAGNNTAPLLQAQLLETLKHQLEANKHSLLSDSRRLASSELGGGGYSSSGGKAPVKRSVANNLNNSGFTFFNAASGGGSSVKEAEQEIAHL